MKLSIQGDIHEVVIACNDPLSNLILIFSGALYTKIKCKRQRHTVTQQYKDKQVHKVILPLNLKIVLEEAKCSISNTNSLLAVWCAAYP